MICKSLLLNLVHFLYRKDEFEELHVSLKDPKDVFHYHIGEVAQQAHFKVAVTGAGISKPSGLPLLSDSIDGIPLQRFFDGSLFEYDTEQFYSSYRKILRRFLQAAPNPAHLSLAASDTWVITQNIDGLHRLAGSKHVLEIHGNIRELLCTGCGLVESSERALHYGVPRCPNCTAVLHPGIVLAGETVRHVSRAVDWAGRAELLFIIGTRLTADPVRQIPDMVEDTVPVVEINQNAEVLLPMILGQEHCQTY